MKYNIIGVGSYIYRFILLDFTTTLSGIRGLYDLHITYD